MIEQGEALVDGSGRWLNAHVADYSGCEAGAEVGFLDFYGKLGGGFGCRKLGDDGLEREIIEGRGFAGCAVMIHGIGTVGGDVHVEDGVSARAIDGFDCDSRMREVVGEASVVNFYVDEFTEPLGGEFQNSF